jgi:hypothetical protein
MSTYCPRDNVSFVAIMMLHGHSNKTMTQTIRMPMPLLMNTISNMHQLSHFLKTWPPSSPDLNPIENLWGIVQAKVEAEGCKTFTGFKQALEEEWQALGKNSAMSLVKSIKKRRAKCIEKGGGRTKY